LIVGKGSERPSARPPEHADFAAARVGGRRRSPIVALGWIGVLAGVVALGLSGRTPDASGVGATATSGPTALDVGSIVLSQAPSGAPIPRASFRPAPVISSQAGRPVALQVQRHPDTMFVHGDVNVAAVTWVFVAVIDGDGRVAGWSSVSVPGGVGPGQDHRPALRFDLEIPVPDWAITLLWVQVTAYDATGRVVGSERLGVDTDGGPVILPIDPDRPLRPETPQPPASVRPGESSPATR